MMMMMMMMMMIIDSDFASWQLDRILVLGYTLASTPYID